MSDHPIQPESEDPRHPRDQTPLLEANPSREPRQQRATIALQQGRKLGLHGGEETDLDKVLQRLDSFLSLLGFNQSSAFRFGVSLTAFSAIGVVLPGVIIMLANCLGCVENQIKEFEISIVTSQAFLAAISLFCLSHNLRKYGIRKFLFVDQYSGHVERFSKDYIQKIRDSIRLLVWWILPCASLKIVREVIRIFYVLRDSLWLSCAISLTFIASWSYVTTIFLSACVMFHLVCNLQVIHFDDYGKLLERETDVMVFIEEHVLLRHDLSKISHRFRIYLLLVFVAATASQFVTLFQIMEYQGKISFINGGDFAVSSFSQVVGIILCLNAAAKISHRAQGVVSIASRWHALATCSTNNNASRIRASTSVGNLEVAGRISPTFSGCDLESLDYYSVRVNRQLASNMSSYHRRQAFVLYLQNNPGGITIFGWTVDRGLINTIFFLELSLVLFVLGRTTVFTISE